MRLIAILLSSLILTGCMSHKITVPTGVKDVYTEMYDFRSTKGGTQEVVSIHRGWLIEKGKMGSTIAYYSEYAPASDFYRISKSFHHNGMIKERGKYLGSVRFGIWETFDELGNRTQVTNEDEKFGSFGPAEVVDFLQKEGWMDCSTGEHKIYLFEKPLKTDGNFYKQLTRVIQIHFIPDIHNKSKPSLWNIKINLGSGAEYREIEYVIDTHAETIKRIHRTGLHRY